ncbi:hypothetical protein AM571_CH02890 [Rhizobium etli 8C-3]|uniref:Uncharacterized protein n=1 Tax=Rhizobium etli 8C-3 TaxID=538025 RepID=A0A1L5P6F0_RHIET|nr:hypothetical protein AM571_CH02890 [Rhizobium etli 8C-3]
MRMRPNSAGFRKNQPTVWRLPDRVQPTLLFQAIAPHAVALDGFAFTSFFKSGGEGRLYHVFATNFRGQLQATEERLSD